MKERVRDGNKMIKIERVREREKQREKERERVGE